MCHRVAPQRHLHTRTNLSPGHSNKTSNADISMGRPIRGHLRNTVASSAANGQRRAGKNTPSAATGMTLPRLVTEPWHPLQHDISSTTPPLSWLPSNICPFVRYAAQTIFLALILFYQPSTLHSSASDIVHRKSKRWPCGQHAHRTRQAIHIHPRGLVLPDPTLWSISPSGSGLHLGLRHKHQCG